MTLDESFQDFIMIGQNTFGNHVAVYGAMHESNPPALSEAGQLYRKPRGLTMSIGFEGPRDLSRGREDNFFYETLFYSEEGRFLGANSHLLSQDLSLIPSHSDIDSRVNSMIKECLNLGFPKNKEGSFAVAGLSMLDHNESVVGLGNGRELTCIGPFSTKGRGKLISPGNVDFFGGGRVADVKIECSTAEEIAKYFHECLTINGRTKLSVAAIVSREGLDSYILNR